MGFVTSLIGALLLVVAVWELRRLRIAIELGRQALVEHNVEPVAPAPAPKEPEPTLIERMIGPPSYPATLPRALDDETEFQVELSQYDTQGAQAGYVVNAHWLEQDERDALAELEEKRGLKRV